MMDFFEFILDAICLMGSFVFGLIGFLVGIATLPIWIIPYLIYKRVKSKDER